MFSFPDFIGEGVFVSVNYGFDAVVHDSEGLEGPEVAAGVGELFVFEQEFVSKLAVEHKVGLQLLASIGLTARSDEQDKAYTYWRSHELGDLVVYFLKAFLRILELSQKGVQECLWTIDIMFRRVMAVHTMFMVWVALNVEHMPLFRIRQ